MRKTRQTFTSIGRNAAFACEQCGADVPPGTHGILRNHCPCCLSSKHVDVNPGDRAESCGGLMKAVEAFYRDGRTILVHQCQRCGARRNNRSAEAPCQAPDDRSKILALMKKASLEV